MRQLDSLSPAEERELDGLERALAGEPVDADLRDLADLVEDVRATAPEMSPGFEARLAHEVAEGFRDSREPAPRRRPRRWVLIPAGGCLAAAVVALVVALAGDGSDHPTRSLAVSTNAAGAADSAGAQPATPEGKSAPRAPLAAPGVATDGRLTTTAPSASSPAQAGATGTSSPKRSSAGASSSSGAGSATPAPAVAPRVGAASGPRRVQRSADLTLQVAAGKLDETADGVVRTVDRFGAIVASSQIGSDDGSGGEATFDLRIPTARLDGALAALSELGHVAARHQELADITGTFTSTEDRLSDARAERRGLLRALGEATTQEHIDSLKARLRIARSQIARLHGDLEALRRRADLSTVSVTVRDGGASAGDGGSGSGSGWTPADAARDALRVLEVIAGVALVALAVAAPLALLGGLVALGVRSGRRRRREGALDAS
ncbi:MAG TPA: DUF4349 domain-containing protein [Solirubrobacteraceae bacterium]